MGPENELFGESASSTMLNGNLEAESDYRLSAYSNYVNGHANGHQSANYCQNKSRLMNDSSVAVVVSNGKMKQTVSTNGVGHCNGNSSSSSSNGAVRSNGSNISNGNQHRHRQSTTPGNNHEEPPYHIVLLCYLSYAVLILFGYLRDFMRKTGLEKNLSAVERNRDGYPQLYKSFESFYTRNIYRRIRDAWNMPISSVPGAYIDVVNRVSPDQNWTFEYPGTTNRVVNMGSYNYLGFAENSGPIHEQIVATVRELGVGVCSPRSEVGLSRQVLELESLMAKFLGVESCAVFGMGFATNSTNIQCFAGSGSLIMSDQLNHASIALGCKLSGATVRTFKHNDMGDLERKLRKLIVEGQPRTGERWKRIVLLVEGIYSMEGTIVNLPELIRIKKLYKCYIYLDEAHSIGALGPRGRGVTDYYNCDPTDVDILMGTFTKSFGAAGGYIAGRKELIELVRIDSFSSPYANPMMPVIAKQIHCVLETIMGIDGTSDGQERIRQLARNTRYFRQKLSQLGFIVYGNNDSPVVPLLICFCPKIAAVIRMAYQKGLGFIGAGFPATALTAGRVRFCISASHTKSMLDQSLEVLNEIGDQLSIKYSRHSKDKNQFVLY